MRSRHVSARLQCGEAIHRRTIVVTCEYEGIWHAETQKSLPRLRIAYFRIHPQYVWVHVHVCARPCVYAFASFCERAIANVYLHMNAEIRVPVLRRSHRTLRNASHVPKHGPFSRLRSQPVFVSGAIKAICEICQRTFDSPQGLSSHMRQIHKTLVFGIEDVSSIEKSKRSKIIDVDENKPEQEPVSQPEVKNNVDSQLSELDINGKKSRNILSWRQKLKLILRSDALRTKLEEHDGDADTKFKMERG